MIKAKVFNFIWLQSLSHCLQLRQLKITQESISHIIQDHGVYQANAWSPQIKLTMAQEILEMDAKGGRKSRKRKTKTRKLKRGRSKKNMNNSIWRRKKSKK